MQHIFQAALDIIATWPDDKFDRAIGYMRKNMNTHDIDYLVKKRELIKQHTETFPRQAAFTLVKR